MPGKEERAVAKREALCDTISKVFLVKVALCSIATTSFITSVLNFGVVQWSNRSYHTFENKDYMTRIQHAYERITNEETRMEWEELSRSVSSAAFVMSYNVLFFGGLICK
jgi:hypothetical protein